jgi:hypothetical protein
MATSADTKNLQFSSLRSVVLPTPNWIVSKEIDYTHFDASTDFYYILFKFDVYMYPNSIIRLHDFAFIVDEAFSGGTAPDVLVGFHSIDESSAAFTDGSTITVGDDDEYFETGDVTLTTAGTYYLSGGDFYTALGTYSGSVLFLEPAAATTYLIAAKLSCTAVPTAGKGRLCAMISTAKKR